MQLIVEGLEKLLAYLLMVLGNIFYINGND